MADGSTGPDPVPAYWTARLNGEAVIGWVLRMQALYRLGRLGVYPGESEKGGL